MKFLLCYIYTILVKNWNYCAYDLSVYPGMNITKIECLKSQVERVYFQHGMSELVRAPTPRRISTRKLWCVRSSPDSDRHLSPKNARDNCRVSAVSTFFPPQPHLLSSLPLLSHSNMWKHVQWCVGSGSDFGGRFLLYAFYI